MPNDSNTVVAPANNTAVAKPEASTEVEVVTEDLALFDTAIFANTPTISKVFGVPVAIKDKNGNVVGGNLKIGKRAVVAAANGLTMGKAHKDKLDAAIQEEQVKAFEAVRAYLLTRPEKSTGLFRMAQRLVGKDAVKQTTLVIRDLPNRTRFYIEKLAESFGLTVEELTAKLEADKAAKLAKTVDIKTTVTTSAPPTAQPIKK